MEHKKKPSLIEQFLESERVWREFNQQHNATRWATAKKNHFIMYKRKREALLCCAKGRALLLQGHTGNV